MEALALASAAHRAVVTVGPSLMECCRSIKKKFKSARLAKRNRMLMDILSPPDVTSVRANVVNVNGLADHQVFMVRSHIRDREAREAIAWAWADSTDMVRERGKAFGKALLVPPGTLRHIISMVADEDDLAVTSFSSSAPYVFQRVVSDGDDMTSLRGQQYYGRGMSVVSAVGPDLVKLSLRDGEEPFCDSPSKMAMLAAFEGEGHRFVVAAVGDDLNTVIVCHADGRTYLLPGTNDTLTRDVDFAEESVRVVAELFNYHQTAGYNSFESLTRSCLVFGTLRTEESPVGADEIITELAKECSVHKAYVAILSKDPEESWSPYYTVREMQDMRSLRGSDVKGRLELSRDEGTLSEVQADRSGRWDAPTDAILTGLKVLAAKHRELIGDHVFRDDEDMAARVNLAVQVLRARVMEDGESWRDYDDVRSGIKVAVIEAGGLTSVRAPSAGYTDVYNCDDEERDIESWQIQPFITDDVTFLDAYAAVLRTGTDGKESFFREVSKSLLKDYTFVFRMRSFVLAYCREYYRTPFRTVKEDVIARHGKGAYAANIIREVATLLVLAGGENSQPDNGMDCVFTVLRKWAAAANAADAANAANTTFEIEFDGTVPFEGVWCVAPGGVLHSRLGGGFYAKLSPVDGSKVRYHASFTRTDLTFSHHGPSRRLGWVEVGAGLARRLH